MLLGTFKTVFNSLFLVPTKTDTRHHVVVMERCCTLKKDRDRGRDRGRKRNLQGQMVCSPPLDTWHALENRIVTL